MIWFGFLGNVMSLIVFALQRRRKAEKRTPNTVGLLMCLAAADSLFLISNIFSRVLPTISKYIYLGEKLKWSLLIRSYSTIWASIFQGFATFLVFTVTLHIYFIVTDPAKAKMCTSRTTFLVPGILLFSISYNIPRFFELTVVSRCNECPNCIFLPTQTRTDLGENVYFQVIYTVIVKGAFIRTTPVISMAVLTGKLVQVSIKNKGVQNYRENLFAKIS